MDKQNELKSLFNQILQEETTLQTPLKGVTLFRIDKSFSRIPYSYQSEVIILVQGEKRVYLGDDLYVYNASNYIVLPVPMPAECEGIVTDGLPILGLRLEIDPIEVGEIISDMAEREHASKDLPKGIYTSPMNEKMYDVTIRLLEAIQEPQDIKILGPMIKREMLYRILQGSNGEVLQSLARMDMRFFRIAKIIQRIHDTYNDDLSIDQMAHDLDMSSSTFYNCFKAVTNLTPLQYIKTIRLHKARTFMIRDGFSASSAAYRVGYESPSQFNREYKRLFGLPPAKDVTIQRP